MTLKLSAKCSDCCATTLVDDNGKILKETDGYVPAIMPYGGGDYVDIEIDLATGKILNWEVPTPKQIEDFLDSNDR